MTQTNLISLNLSTIFHSTNGGFTVKSTTRRRTVCSWSSLPVEHTTGRLLATVRARKLHLVDLVEALTKYGQNDYQQTGIWACEGDGPEGGIGAMHTSDKWESPDPKDIKGTGLSIACRFLT